MSWIWPYGIWSRRPPGCALDGDNSIRSSEKVTKQFPGKEEGAVRGRRDGAVVEQPRVPEKNAAVRGGGWPHVAAVVFHPPACH